MIFELFSVIYANKTINEWFIKEYLNVYVDILALYLDFLKEQGDYETIDLMLSLENPETISQTYIFNYGSANQQSKMEMLQELLDGEGESEIDDEEVKALMQQPDANEDVPKIQAYCKTLSQSIWDILLRKIKKDDVLKVLKSMNTKIFPHVSNPLVFSDFIISAYDCVDMSNESSADKAKVKQDVIISIHALSSLFILLTNHGLDYTSINYYTKLYYLLNYFELIFSLKERFKFLRLLELSIKSPLLPSAIAASFIKKILRILVVRNVAEVST